MYSCIKLILWIRLPGDEPLKALAPIETNAAPAISDRETIAAVAACDDTSSVFFHTLGFPLFGDVHSHLSSTSHTSLHPSSVLRLSSSHCSPMSLCPSPHIINTTNY